MIILQAMSILVLLLILILVYSAIHKMLKEHKEKYNTDTDQDNLDLSDKQ